MEQWRAVMLLLPATGGFFGGHDQVKGLLSYLAVLSCSIVPTTGEGHAAPPGGLGPVPAVGMCTHRGLHRQQSQPAAFIGHAGGWHHPQEHTPRSVCSAQWPSICSIKKI